MDKWRNPACSLDPDAYTQLFSFSQSAQTLSTLDDQTWKSSSGSTTRPSRISTAPTSTLWDQQTIHLAVNAWKADVRAYLNKIWTQNSTFKAMRQKEGPESSAGPPLLGKLRPPIMLGEVIKEPRFQYSANKRPVVNLNSGAIADLDACWLPLCLLAPSEEKANNEFTPEEIISDPGPIILIDECNVKIRD
ncbi:hypothetical protein POM88_031552 [Heracleum sosnowskyi]|uniref:Uncharacterized protein n=1 Tax=Heracleum sosnowskyi TaxID=360622 RepID=A0AAD8HYV7_9APIA|nr:hypothetical protein POM88_031552 [Heracleum sosnowskyi]